MIRPDLTLRPADILLIILVVTIAVLSGFKIYGGRSGQARLVIEAPSGDWIYDLETTRTVDIPGPLGSTRIRIENGQARVIDSPCTNKTCIAAPPIAHKGEWTACLPNHVMLRIDHDHEDDQPDAIVR